MLDKREIAKSVLLDDTFDSYIMDSVAVACHYDDATLLCKNGAIIQIIEVTGREMLFEKAGAALHQDISKAISEVADYKIAAQIYTIRSRKNITGIDAQKQSSAYAANVNHKWCQSNGFNNELVNSVYIALTHQPQDLSPYSAQSLLGSLIPGSALKKHTKNLQLAHQKLTGACDCIISLLKDYGARKLGVLEGQDGEMLSEPLMFLHHLLHLSEARVPLENIDASVQLSYGDIKFNFNSIEISNKNEQRTIAAVFSLKDDYDILPSRLHEVLQIPMEYILCQTVIFIPRAKALKHRGAVIKAAQLSANKNITTLLDPGGAFLASRAEAEKEKYCLQQSTIVVFGADKTAFTLGVKNLVYNLNQIGTSYVREDFNMAALFLGQQPGNLRFLDTGRFTATTLHSVGRYGLIFDSESGNFNGSKWGAPVCIIRSTNGVPFYFNFHTQEGKGNTLMIGPLRSGKTVLSRFLLSQAVKLNPTIIYLDFAGTAKSYIEALGGTYYNDEALSSKLKFNPFTQNMLGDGIVSIKEWLIDVIMPRARDLENYDEIFVAVAERILNDKKITSIPDAICTLMKLLNDSSVNRSTEDFFGVDGKFFRYLSEKTHKNSVLNVAAGKIVAFDLSVIASDVQLLNGYVGLLLDAISKSIAQNTDKHPTIVFIDKFDLVCSISHCRKFKAQWLQYLSENNAMILGSCIHDIGLEKNEDYQAIIQNIQSLLFLSDKSVDKYFRRCYDLSGNELHQIKSHAANKHMLLVKQGKKHKTLFLDLTEIKKFARELDALQNQ